MQSVHEHDHRKNKEKVQTNTSPIETHENQIPNTNIEMVDYV